MKVPDVGSWLWRRGRAQSCIWVVLHVPFYLLVLAVVMRLVGWIGRWWCAGAE